MVNNMERILNVLYDRRNSLVKMIEAETENRRLLDEGYTWSVRESNTKIQDLQEDLNSVDKALVKLNRN